MRLTWTKVGEPGDNASKTVASGAVLVVGRQAGNDITLPDSQVSRAHARLTIGQDSIRVEDLGSTNGTRLAGEAIGSAVWRPGQFLEIGAYRFELSPLGEASASAARPG